MDLRSGCGRAALSSSTGLSSSRGRGSVQAACGSSRLDSNGGRVDDSSGSINEFEGDLCSGSEVDDPGGGRSILLRERGESSGGGLTTGNDGDVVRSGGGVPFESDGDTLRQGGRGVDGGVG